MTIRLPNRDQALYVKLSGAPTTRNPTYAALGSYGILNGATAVKLLAGGGKQKEFSGDDVIVFNDDTAAVTMTVYVLDGGVARNIEVKSLAVNEQWTLDSIGTGGPTLIGAVTNGDDHNHAGGDGAQVDHGALGGLSDDDHTQYLLVSGTRANTGAQTFAGVVTMNAGLTLGDAKATHMADVDETIAAGDVDDDTKRAALFTAYGAKINDILGVLETLNLVAAA